MKSPYTQLIDHAEAKGMEVLELIEWVDNFRWFPRTHHHCAETYVGRQLKKYGYHGFFEHGTTYNMDTVYAYIDEHDLALNTFLKELDELATLIDEYRMAVEESAWHERFWDAA